MEIFKERLVSHLFSQHLGRIWIKSLAPKWCFKDKCNADYFRIIWEAFLKTNFWPYLKHVKSKSLEETPGKLYFLLLFLKKKSSLHGSEDLLSSWNSGGLHSTTVKMQILILQVLREELRFFWISKRLPYLLVQTFY